MFTEVSTQFVNDISALAISQLYPSGSVNKTEQFSFSECPLRRKHELEFAASAIPADMWENCITHYSNTEICNYHIGENVPRINTGRAIWSAIRQFDGHHTGWTFDNFYPATQFKPDEPKPHYVTSDIVKYMSVKGVPTDIYRPKLLPERITQGRTVEQVYVDHNADEVGFITEGAKKVTSLISLGLPAIGLFGINSIKVGDDGAKVLNPNIVEFVRNKKTVIIAFDTPNKLTSNAGLESAIHSLSKEIRAVNPKCAIQILCWYPSWGKGCDDVIAAGHITRENIRQFAKVYYEGIFHLESTIASHKRITGSRHLELGMVENFLDKFVGLKAGKGSGKTETTATYIKSLPLYTAVIAITHRTKLRKQNALRLGLDCHNDRNGKDTSASHRLAICLPSILRKNIDVERFRDGIMFLDEVKQLLDFIYSRCIRHSREVIEVFMELCAVVKQIIIADADLDIPTIQLLDALMPGADFIKKLKVYEFVQDVPKMPMTVHKVSNRRVGAALHDSAFTHIVEGRKPIIFVDSQKPTSKLSAENQVRSLENAVFEATGKVVKGLAIYSKSTKNGGHEASRVIKEGVDVIFDPQYDFVIYTTVIGTGVSLDLDRDYEKPHFDVVLGAFSGTISLDDILQGLHRYRRLVPREVFLPEKGIAAPHSGASYSWRQNRLNTNKVTSEVLSLYSAIAQEIPEQNNEVNRPLETYDCKRRARLKYECDHYFDMFLKKASVDYEITVDGKKVGAEVPTTLEDAVKATFDEYKAKIQAASSITNDDRYQELKAQEVVLEKEHDDLTRTEIEKKFDIESAPSLINDDLLEADKRQNFLSGLRNHYYLERAHFAEFNGISNIKRDDTLNFDKIPHDPYYKTLVLTALKSSELIASAGKSLHSEHPLVKKIIREAQRLEEAAPGLIKRHLNINVPKKGDTKYDPMKMIDSLALKLAITKQSKGRVVLESGIRVRVSKYIIEDSIRYEIFPIWDENNEVRELVRQRKDIEAQVIQIQDNLRNASTEQVKTPLRKQLSDTLKFDDTLKDRLIEINDDRNLRCKFQRYAPCSPSYENITTYSTDNRPQGTELLRRVKESMS